MFFSFGLYARHLARFHRHFGRGALLVECSEEFYADPWPTVQRVLAFADLPIVPSHAEAVRASTGATPVHAHARASPRARAQGRTRVAAVHADRVMHTLWMTVGSSRRSTWRVGPRC